jgi:hypothetical protein
MECGDLIWSFETANFKVQLWARPESDLDLSWDDDNSVRENLESGAFVAFCANVRVIHKPTLATLGEDYLGSCIYESPSDFMDHRECGAQNRAYAARGETARCGSHFTQMIHEAIENTRTEVARMQTIRLRK